MKRFTAIILTGILAAQLAICTAPSAVAVQIEEEPMYQQKNRMSDEEFFGKWNEETQTWDIEGKINYDYQNNKDLKAVENYVKAGDYYNAREGILLYYQNRTLKHPIQETRDEPGARVLAEGIFTSETPALEIFAVGTEPQWYRFDVTGTFTETTDVAAYTLHSINRDFGEEGSEQIVNFDSKEKRGGNASYLVVKQGIREVRVPISGDAYIRGGKFINTNYGLEDSVQVSEWWPSPETPLPSTGAAPHDVGTRQGQLKYALSDYIDPSVKISEATLYLYGSATEEGKEVALFQSKNNAWGEEDVKWSNYPLQVYSYRGIPGEYDWRLPAGAHAQFYNVNSRLWNLPKMFKETYDTKNPWFAQRGTEIFLDMIEENGGLTYDWYYAEKRLNAAFRGDPYSEQCFFGALLADQACRENRTGRVLDGESFTSLLKFMWQEPEAMTGPLMEGQININGLAFAIDSLLRYCTYFPEFKDRERWVKKTEERILQFRTDGFASDGGYKEATSGYDIGVLNSCNRFYSIVKPGDVKIPEEFEEFYSRFARAEMGLAMLSGAQYGWGDGGPYDNIRTVLKNAGENLDDQELIYFGTNGASGVQPDYTSFFLPVSKLASMRSGWKPETDVQGWLIGRAGGSHGHRHVNQMNVFAYGRLLLMDTGRSSYDNRHPAFQWQGNRTESHNTVEVNETGQKFSNLWETMLNDTDTTMYTNNKYDFYNCVARVYNEATHTRKVAFIKNQKFFIVSDFMTAIAPRAGGNLYNQTWHFPVAGANASINEKTGVIQTNFVSGANLTLNPVSPEKLDSASLDLNPMDTRHASYKVTSSDNVVMNTVIYPTENKPVAIPTEAIEVDANTDNNAAAFTMQLPDGSEGLYYVNNNVSVPHRFNWYDALASSCYMETDASGKMKTLAATDVSYVKQNGQALMIPSKKLTDLSVSFSGVTANIESTDAVDLTKDYIRIAAPENIETVMFNEEMVPFIKVDGDIVIGNFVIRTVTQIEEDGTKSAVLPGMTISYPIIQGNNVFWAELVLQDQTKVTGDGAWQGVINLQPIQETSVKLGNGSLGEIPLEELKTDKVISVKFPENERWRAAVLTDDGRIMPEKEIAEDNTNLAQTETGENEAVYYEGDGYAKVYARQLADIVIYSESPLPNTGGNSNTGSNHIGGGSPGGGPGVVVTPPPTTAPSAEPSAAPGEGFRDTEQHWAREAISELSEKGYVQGDENGNFNPDNNITRAETVSILARILQLETTEYSGVFLDVPENSWYRPSVEAAQRAGIVDGDGGRFAPEAHVTRAELCKMVIGAYEKLGGELSEGKRETEFTDESDLPEWAKPYIDKAYMLELVFGMEDGSFQPAKGATRAETVMILSRMLKRIDT